MAAKSGDTFELDITGPKWVRCEPGSPMREFFDFDFRQKLKGDRMAAETCEKTTVWNVAFVTKDDDGDDFVVTTTVLAQSRDLAIMIGASELEIDAKKASLVICKPF